MRLPYIAVVTLTTCILIGLISANKDVTKHEFKRKRVTRQTSADQMVQNILQWLQGVYSQQSRKIRQGTLREYLPPINTEKPRPFEPNYPVGSGVDGNGNYIDGGYPPAGSITPEPPFPIYTNPATGAITGVGYPSPTGPTGPTSFVPGYPTGSEGPSTSVPSIITEGPPGDNFSSGPTLPSEISGIPSITSKPDYGTGFPTGPEGPTAPSFTQSPNKEFTSGITQLPSEGTESPSQRPSYPGSGFSTQPPLEFTGYPTSQPSYTPSGTVSSERPGFPTTPPNGNVVTEQPGFPTAPSGDTYNTERPGIPTEFPSGTGFSTSPPSGTVLTDRPGFPTAPPSGTFATERPGFPTAPPKGTFATEGPGFPTGSLSTERPGFTSPPVQPGPGFSTYGPPPTDGNGYTSTISVQPPSEGPIVTEGTPGESPITQSPEINTIPTNKPGKPDTDGSETDIDEDLKHPPHIHDIDVICAKDMMTINIEFNREFNGVIYSKGFYNMPECRYVQENSGEKKYSFTLNLNMCGTEFINAFDTQGQSYLENVLVLQNEAGIQEIWDTVRAVRCLWEGSLKESLSVALSVGMLTQELVTFSGDTAMAKLDILLGKGPFGPAANGLVKIGEPMTLVVSVTGDPGFDIQVKDCRATDSSGDNIVPLTDNDGCVLKPKLFGSFQKTRNTGNSGASIIAFAYFNAFKFPDVMDLMIECNIELCKTDCEMCSQLDQPIDPSRRKRDLHSANQTLHDGVTMGKHLRIILPEDLKEETVINIGQKDNICMSTHSFVFSSSLMVLMLVFSCIFSAYTWLKAQGRHLNKI